MQTDKKYALLISGGVDSAVACHLLCEQGIKPDLFYIKIGMQGEGTTCTAEEDIELSTLTAKRYGLQLNIVDLQQEYHNRVTAYVVERVKRGLTPNPDVMCNRLIKFGAFEEKAGYAYDYIATGHYAQTYHDAEGQLYLAPAPDPVKDQSDFLSQLTDVQAQKLCFPIGHLLKHEVRDIADREHLAPAHRRDSQGICFLGKINYNDYLRMLLGEREGEVIERETGKVIGKHKGYWFHTVGQRKGLGLGGGPWFVTDKDIERNIIYVSHTDACHGLYGTEFHLTGFQPTHGKGPPRWTCYSKFATPSGRAPATWYASPTAVFSSPRPPRYRALRPASLGCSTLPMAKFVQVAAKSDFDNYKGGSKNSVFRILSSGKSLKYI